MSFSYQYEAVKEAARQQEREYERDYYQPEAAEAAEQDVAQTGGWRERIARAFTPAAHAATPLQCDGEGTVLPITNHRSPTTDHRPPLGPVRNTLC